MEKNTLKLLGKVLCCGRASRSIFERTKVYAG
jgi:hypothetical protein